MSLDSEIFKTVDSIPKSYWENLNCNNNIYYSPEFLKAFELANTAIEFNYLFILKNGKAVAFANTQTVTIGVETITKNIDMSYRVRRFVNNLFCKNHIKVLFCGNVFLSGEYGTFLKEGEPKVKTFKAIAKAVKKLYRCKRLSTIFIKDFEDESLYLLKKIRKSRDLLGIRTEG